jgi:hypothetical protein
MSLISDAAPSSANYPPGYIMASVAAPTFEHEKLSPRTQHRTTVIAGAGLACRTHFFNGLGGCGSCHSPATASQKRGFALPLGLVAEPLRFYCRFPAAKRHHSTAVRGKKHRQRTISGQTDRCPEKYFFHGPGVTRAIHGPSPLTGPAFGGSKTAVPFLSARYAAQSWFAKDQPRLPVAVFAVMRLTHGLSRPRPVKSVVLTGLPDSSLEAANPLAHPWAKRRPITTSHCRSLPMCFRSVARLAQKSASHQSTQPSPNNPAQNLPILKVRQHPD